MSNDSLFCPHGIHGSRKNESEILSQLPKFDDSVASEETKCCAIGDRISAALSELKSALTSISPSLETTGSERALRSYDLSNALQNRCRPAVIAKDSAECELIRETQEQQRFRKKLEPLAIGSHLIHWPIYQTTLHVYFHSNNANDRAVIDTTKDPVSEVTLPKTIIHKPFEYADPIHPPENATLNLFQFNLVAITSESLQKLEWQKALLNKLFTDGKWGICGESHNFLIPFFLCPDRDTPDFVQEEITRYSFVLNQSGQFVGDLALKLILPTVFYTNRYLIEHFAKLNTRIEFIPQPNPKTDITAFVAALFDIYNAAHHLVIYCPLSTVITRSNNNLQLNADVVQLIQSITIASQRLLRLGGDLIVNSAINASGVVGRIETGCSVDERFREQLKYKTVEELMSGGLTWILASFPEYYLNTEVLKEEAVMREAVSFLLSFFGLFLSKNELETSPENSSMTLYKFDSEKKFYLKHETSCDIEIQKFRNTNETTLENKIINKTTVELQGTAAPTQCLNTDGFRFSQFLIDGAPEGVQVDGIASIIQVSLRLCLYRTIPVLNQSPDPNHRDCVPVFPFKRWKSDVGKDRFGNPKPGWSNPFNPLFNILISAISFMQKNWKNKDFRNLLPLYYEVVFQIFNPLTTLSDPNYMKMPLNSDMYNNKDLHDWAFQIGNLIKRPRNHDINEKNLLFKTIYKYWMDFDSSKLVQLKQRYIEKQTSVYSTKIPGGFGILKLEGHLQSPGPVGPDHMQSQSYGDPVFEALHMQIPLLLFSPEGLSRHVPAIQMYAYYAHPVQRTLLRTPPHCYFFYRSKRPNKNQNASSLSIAHFESESGRQQSQITAPPSISDLSIIEWSRLNNLDMNDLIRMMSVHSAQQARDLLAAPLSTLSLSSYMSDASSHVSSENLPAEQEVGTDGSLRLSLQEEQIRRIFMSASPVIIESFFNSIDDLSAAAIESEYESLSLDSSSGSRMNEL